MSKKNARTGNMKLAGLFILTVLGIILLSFFFKIVFLINESKFDGFHKFNVEFIGKDETSIISFSPQAKSVSILKIPLNINRDNLAKSLAIAIDGTVLLKSDIKGKSVSAILIKSSFSFGNLFKKLTIIDLIRLTLFTRSVSANSIYEREFSLGFNDAQKSTILSLSFTDPAIYQENQSIEIINAANIYGLGGKLANLITNMGGNVILVSNANKLDSKSRIIYFGEKTYTGKKLESYLAFPLEKVDKKGIADVIIIIGTDSINKINF